MSGPGGVANYSVVEEACTKEWVVENVTPHIRDVFGDGLSYLFGKALLWLAFQDNLIEWIPADMRQSIKTAYAAVGNMPNGPVRKRLSKARPKITTDLLDDFNSLDSSDDEDDSLLEKGASKSIATSTASLHSSAKKKRLNRLWGSVSLSAKKTRTRGNGTAKEDQPDFMEEYLGAKQITKAANLNERERHNKKMKEIEESKNKWKSKMEKLEYKKQLMTTKFNLEAEGFDKEQIIAMFPELEVIYLADEVTTQEWVQKCRKIYINSVKIIYSTCLN